jgi:hypothetical protein
MITATQRKALEHLDLVEYATPAEIGHTLGSTKTGSAQGAGRLGASVLSRLLKSGLAENCSFLRHGFPAYRITGAGRDVVRQAGESRT